MKFLRLTRNLTRATVLAAGLVFAVGSPTETKAQDLLGMFFGPRVDSGVDSFKGANGCPVTVEWYAPADCCKAPAVILLHGSDGPEKYAAGYKKMAKGLAASGYAAFIVHYFEGTNAPIPDPDDKEFMPPDNHFRSWMGNVGRAITWVRKQPFVQRDRVALAGVSLGGYLASAQASEDARVKTVIIASGGLPKQLYDKVQNLPPTLILHGQCDDVVSAREATKLHGALAEKKKSHKIRIFPGEGHAPFNCHDEEAAQLALDYLDRNL